ncbi:MAG: tRNA (guanosine(46)-N7)-methyltransferase TrmB [Pseudomonadales bacterium]|nr:tRNA (guanosine(46)-N7)-methyltransferase TrmB [Pseudomonadales bacterium]
MSQARALEHGEEYLVDAGDQILEMEELFDNDAAITLEIGFGVGQALLEMAECNPEKNYLGIEVYLPGIGALIHQCQLRAIKNIRVIRGDAKYVLANNCRPDSFTQINIFFPDPWPKRKHLKRRIIQQDMVRLIAQRLKPGGRVYLATDWENYADWMLQEFCQEPALKNMSVNKGFSERFKERPMTRFESRGIRLGHEVWDLCFEK